MQVQSADYVPASCARPYFLVSVGVCDDVGKRVVGSASGDVGSGVEASSIGFRFPCCRLPYAHTARHTYRLYVINRRNFDATTCSS